MHKTKLTSFFLLIALLLASCATNIDDIQKNTEKYVDKEVTIKGKVISSTNAMLVKYFAVKDDTGEIYVTTENALPNENEKIKITGKVRQYFKIGDLQLTVIIEEKREKPLF